MQGPIVCDIASTRLSEAEASMIANPLVGMVILFTRNYSDRAQLTELCRSIHAVKPDVLISVDHEGGRVQRFREGFTEIPAMRRYGALWRRDKAQARTALRAATFVMAAELRDCGVDLTFAPVLDLDWGRSTIIGERSLGATSEAVIDLAQTAIGGLADAGMANCGKHFPGHGYVVADSHLDLPVDDRAAEAILKQDFEPYKALSRSLTSVMTAHVVYPGIDAVPATFSQRIIRTYLRDEAGFDGVVFSDDLSMQGAKSFGGVLDRAQGALAAGCDALIVCNDSASRDALIAGLQWTRTETFARRVDRLNPKPKDWSDEELENAKKTMFAGLGDL